MRRNYAFIVCTLCVVFLTIVQCYNVNKYALLMPNVRPNKEELYLCTPVKVDPSQNYYLIGFEPNATQESAHHIILYGCRKPGSSKSIWNCGEMAHRTNDNEETMVPCAEESQILYAWARDAPTLILPEGVGFKVGGDSPIKYLVLQVHYAHIDLFKDGRTDDSGVFLHYTLNPLNKLAGVLLLGTSGVIPPRSTTYMETACTLKENKTIHPFAYRTHTHSLGKVVSGYLVKPDYTWIELGKRDPLTPQMFYRVHNEVSAGQGDRIAARCTMRSTRDIFTYIGSTKADEMCNFYLMYYVENDEPLSMKYCFTNGPPSYYWKYAGLMNIPNREASTL
ncbi:peptidylglycine-alpha-hydroxylating monooxygenase [Megachile rotundata]|uniref:peptidylglycine-alpha-hydroxylating monooxygenase n=1 Tax=Megachile rotundata TaxID=143995 RepID=UPI000258F154|nr:PREDICTED: peptidylglycine alpha-hydroxylating monooxygenase [Megachile rotundata]XP_012147443.1 PREDICTED: peptidylglycine alpha-hydroxylating monooxygenase [Megachile rotundata]